MNTLSSNRFFINRFLAASFVTLSIFCTIAHAGGKDTGGGNGVQSADGQIIPLDLYFAHQNTQVDPQKKFPTGYKYFTEQIEKIRQAIPSFAADLERNFSDIKWIVTQLDLKANSCMNNMGIYRVESNSRVVILACQNQNREVILSAKNIMKLKRPEYLGAVFLHEVFVSQMLYTLPEVNYPETENTLVTRITPYIFANHNLNAEILYDFALSTGFVSRFKKYNKYTIEVFPKMRMEWQAYVEQSAPLQKSIDDYYDTIKVIQNCDTEDTRINSEASLLAFYQLSFSKYNIAIAAGHELSLLELKLTDDLPNEFYSDNIHIMPEVVKRIYRLKLNQTELRKACEAKLKSAGKIPADFNKKAATL